ncbi:MAG: hypothetical protein QNJ72_36920 [Pleurocapsa sp. MO_226.B13]|nr:hypothetical protein [Pleurocapsa sp. MO_226.B13]
MAEANPEIAEWIDIGDSYDKVTPGGEPGYDIHAIELTNKDSGVEDKPTLYVVLPRRVTQLILFLGKKMPNSSI